MTKVRIIVMAYNEAENLPHVLADVARELAEIPHEVIVIDDGSIDGTGDAARAAGVRVIEHNTNRGLGGVYRTGFMERGSGWLTFIPADGQYPATNVLRLLSVSDDKDLVLGVLPGRRETLLSHIFSRTERLLYRALLGPLPPFQGLFLVRAGWLDPTDLLSEGRGWAIVMEMLYEATRRKARIGHAELELLPRMSGRSKVQNPRTVIANLKQIFRLSRQLRLARRAKP